MATKIWLVLFFTSLILGGFSGVQAQTECNVEANGFSGDSISGHVGQSYILSCSCQNVDLEAVTYTWMKNDSLISGETVSTLTLSQLMLSDAGIYSCSIELNGVVYKSSIDITIQIPAPSYVMISSNKPNPIRPIGSNVSLTCMVGLQPSTVSTTVSLNLTILVKDPAGNTLSTTAYSVNGSTYTSRVIIGSFGRSQSGVYMCDATLTSPSLHLSESSTVTEEIRLNSGVYLSLGRAIGIQNNTCASISQIGSSLPHQLACVTDRKPCCLSHGEWYYPNGSQIRSNSGQNSFYVERTNEGSINLFRPGNVLEPHGKFCCKSADAMDVNHTLCIDLVPSISIIIDDNGANPVAGLNYNLSCEVSGIDGNLSTVSYVIEWKKDDTPLSETGPLLSFSPLKLSDTGEYSCTINIHGCSFKHSKDLSRMEVMSDAISVALVSDRQSPLGHPGVDIQVICVANISAFVDIPATMQVMDPAGRVLATETYNFSSIYTLKALISSFKDEYAGNYTCTFTVTTPALQSITKTETVHIYIGVRFLFKGKIYGNNSLFFINEIGRTISSSALQCVTDKGNCCWLKGVYYIGEWYFPNGSRVLRQSDSTEFYRNRDNNGAVNLNRFSNDIMSPITNGRYCCHIPDNTTVNQILCAYVVAVQVSEEIVPQVGLTNYSLACNLSGAKGHMHPTNNLTFQWFKDINGTQTQVGSNTSVLSFSQPLKLSSAGRYTCEVSRVYNFSHVLAKAEASWDVRIQSPTIELNVISDPPSPIRPIGSRVSLNCSCDIAPNLPAEYIDIGVSVSISLRDPSGTLLSATAHAPLVYIYGTVYTSSAVINSFGRDQSGNYNCTASVNSSPFINSQKTSTLKRITTGVYLSLEGSIIPPYGVMMHVTDIGTSSPNQLICASDRKPCCQDQPQYGGWYFPNRSRVAHISERPTPTAFHSDRNSRGEISLYRISTDVKSPVGQFCCETMDADDTNHTLCVTVLPPIIANITTEGTARVGQAYTLVCSVLSGLEGLNAVPSYQWTKDNGTRSHLGANSNILSFPSLRLSDAGSYTCEIMVNSSRLLKQATVRTATQVKVSIPQPNIDLVSSAPNPILSGSSPTLLCIVELHPAVDIPVDINFVWISPHDSTLMSALVVKSSSLYTSKVVLNDVSLEDAGQYTCKATIGSKAIIIGSDNSVSAQKHVEIGDDMFQLRLKYTDDCREWYKSSFGEIEMYKYFIEEALIEAIKLRCECHFPRENLLQESFSCSSSPHLTTYRNTLVSTHNVNASQLVGFIQDWVNSGPRITIKGGYSVWVDKKCPVAVSSFDEPECGGQ